jgi:hypothetical protein
MQVAEQKRSLIAEKLSSISRRLPFSTEQGWKFSLSYIEKYLKEHADNGTGLDADQAAMMAAGRLGWLLLETRPTLSGLFSEQNITALLDCCQGNMFFPDQVNGLASDLCDHLGIEVDDYAASAIAPLIEKLRGLNAVQRMTLADALEQTWYRGMKEEQREPKDFLASMGIVLV